MNFNPMKVGWVYIMTNKHNTTLYTGVTSNIMKRVLQHKKGLFPGSFSDQFLCHKLVWFEEYRSITEAIVMEKRIKRWLRLWKEELIAKKNPEWFDLSEGWYDERDLLP
jgi:putative endonuclease